MTRLIALLCFLGACQGSDDIACTKDQHCSERERCVNGACAPNKRFCLPAPSADQWESGVKTIVRLLPSALI